jgi:CubicO group peptidase (beta-lactamase class C family)
MELRLGTPEEAGMSAQRIRRVADLAKGWVDQGITPALVVLAAWRGVIVLHEAFGRLTPETDSPPVQRDTIYPLASITKPITATAAMILVEDGLLGLNRPVCEYLPEFAGEGKQAVMVHHLLTHTSGLQQEQVDAHAESKQGTIEIPVPEETQYPAIHEALLLRYDAPLWKPPGTEMSYCNYGYLLLGEIIRRVSGTSLDQFARERIFAPLGMKDTFYIVPDSVRHRIVRRPADAPAAEMLNSRELQDRPGPAGGVFSTAVDTAIFGQMFLNGGSYGDARILSPASVAAMTRNQIPGVGAQYGEEFFPEASWGYGWNIEGNKHYVGRGTLQSSATFSHGGVGGVSLWIDPVYEIVGVCFSVSLWLIPDKSVRSCIDLFMNAVTAAVLAE